MATRIFSPDLTVILTKLDKLGSLIPVETTMTTKKFAEQILWDSKNTSPMCPVDTGDLEDTGHVEQIEGARPVQWAIVYGGASKGKFVDYANEVHDDLRPRNYKKPGSGPKFVSSHVDRRTPDMTLNMNASLKSLILKVGLV